MENKLFTFENLLNSCYCSLDLFLENYGKDISDLRKDILKCETEKDLKDLINSYI